MKNKELIEIVVRTMACFICLGLNMVMKKRDVISYEITNYGIDTMDNYGLVLSFHVWVGERIDGQNFCHLHIGICGCCYVYFPF